MGLNPSTTHGFNGGTVTLPTTFKAPVTIDLTADLADRTALDVIQPATFGFTVRPFRFRQTDFAYFQMETTGVVSSAGNDLSTDGGALDAKGAALRVRTASGTQRFILDPNGPQAGFFAAAEVGQQSHVAQPSGGAIQDAEARAALNALITAIQNLGLTAAS